ncbi:MAG: AbrB/MazE/SpoVT family DNA-binding domain-containing protein [Desulfobacterales bacterium]|nr:AbrB/MazE/SpoVT family DNA-binding domain-containing protein [Desulfobacterales bacterium]
MRSRIVKIGNSKGIRIPKPFLDQTGIGEDVELEVESNRIIVRPVLDSREGWEDSFKAMAETGDDKPLIDDENLDHSWDEEEWQW